MTSITGEDVPAAPPRPRRWHDRIRITLSAALARWRHNHSRAETLADEFRHENLRRLRYVVCALLPLNLLHVLLFSQPGASGVALEAQWRSGVIWSHLGMALLMGLLGGCAHALLGRWHSRRAEQLVLLAALAATLGFGGLLAVVDQWITPAITPVLIGSLAVGLVFLIRPALAAGLFASFGLLIVWGLGLTQQQASVLLSNRVNTVTAMLMGAALSTLLWSKAATNTLLRRQLEQSNLALQRQQVELQHLATRDPLTGLFNRREFERLFRLELVRAHRARQATALVAIDLDHFKRINDQLGHPAGDAVLHQVAQHMLGLLRRPDVLSRYGGEEFMLLLPDTDLAAAAAVAEKLRSDLALLPIHLDGQTVRVTASLGVTGTWAAASSFEQLYAQADQALYRAKQDGRNRVERSIAAA